MTYPLIDEEDALFQPIWERCREYTMTSFERGLALYRSIRYVAENGLQGDIVECGVWRGGSAMVALMSLEQFGISDRRVWLFDTFEGMTSPTSFDIDLNGRSAKTMMAATVEQKSTEPVWAFASLEEVRTNIERVGYNPDFVTYVKGDVRRTIHEVAIENVALLRLDTDFYDSTKIELEVLYPKLTERGVLIVDDVGHWRGARRAVEEYFSSQRIAGKASPLFNVIDYTGRLAVKC